MSIPFQASFDIFLANIPKNMYFLDQENIKE